MKFQGCNSDVRRTAAALFLTSLPGAAWTWWAATASFYGSVRNWNDVPPALRVIVLLFPFLALASAAALPLFASTVFVARELRVKNSYRVPLLASAAVSVALVLRDFQRWGLDAAGTLLNHDWSKGGESMRSFVEGGFEFTAVLRLCNVFQGVTFAWLAVVFARCAVDVVSNEHANPPLRRVAQFFWIVLGLGILFEGSRIVITALNWQSAEIMAAERGIKLPTLLTSVEPLIWNVVTGVASFVTPYALWRSQRVPAKNAESPVGEST